MVKNDQRPRKSYRSSAYNQKWLTPTKNFRKLRPKWPRVILWSRVLNGSFNEFWINHFHTIDSIRVHLIFFSFQQRSRLHSLWFSGTETKGISRKVLSFGGRDHRNKSESKSGHYSGAKSKMNDHEEQSRQSLRLRGNLLEVWKACQPGRPAKLNDRPIVFDRLLWSIFVYFLPFTF